MRAQCVNAYQYCMPPRISDGSDVLQLNNLGDVE